MLVNKFYWLNFYFAYPFKICESDEECLINEGYELFLVNKFL